MDKKTTFREWLAVVPFTDFQMQTYDRPMRVGKKVVPENLDDLTIGQLIELSTPRVWVMVGKQMGKHLSQNATICGSLRFIYIFIASLKSPILRRFCPFSAPFLIIPMWSWRELGAGMGVGCVYAGWRGVH